MTKTEKINRLLEENRTILLNEELNNGICFDGIVDEDTYDLQKIKVAVLLKETNGNDYDGKETVQQDDWPYYLWLRNQQANNEPETRIKNGKEYLETNVFYHHTFKKLCHWLSMFWEVFETGTTNPGNFLLDGKVNIEQVRRVLKRVAVINLKKSWGKSSTDRETLKSYATKEKISDVFKKQLKEMETNVILCCSPDVFWIVNLIYDEEYQKLKYSEGNKEMFIVDGYVFVKLIHPQWYGKKESVLANEMKEIFEWAVPIIKEKIICKAE